MLLNIIEHDPRKQSKSKEKVFNELNDKHKSTTKKLLVRNSTTQSKAGLKRKTHPNDGVVIKKSRRLSQAPASAKKANVDSDCPSVRVQSGQSAVAEPSVIKRRGRRQGREEAPDAEVDWSSVSDCLLEEVRDVERLVEESAHDGDEEGDVFSEHEIKDNKELHPYLLSHLTEKMKMRHFTRVQAETIPLLMAGHDVLVKSQTGSGKSLAFCLPLVQLLQAEQPPLRRDSGLRALVLSPTRELAQQTHDLLVSLLRPFCRIVSGLLVGGVKRKAQKASLRRGLNVAVATPQRLLDHLRHTSHLSLNDLRLLIIDEADKLTELGFERDVAAVVEAAVAGGRRPQTALCSATLGEGVQRLAGLSLLKPCSVTEEAAIPTSIGHNVLAVPHKLRLQALLSWLRPLIARRLKAVLFLPTQASVDFHHLLLSTLLGEELEDGVRRLHGDMPHAKRSLEFRHFADDANAGLLVTTDVCARGLDLRCVRWVVQFGCPGHPDHYCHRVGRTARLGRPGRGLLFLSTTEAAPYLRLLRDTVGVRCAPLSLRSLLRLTPDNFGQVVDLVNKNERLKRLAEEAFVSTLRAYASCTGELREIFRFKSLHLGHVAASFCLRDSPSDVAARVKRRRLKNKEAKSGAKMANVEKKAKKEERDDAGDEEVKKSVKKEVKTVKTARRTSKVAGGRRLRVDVMSEFASGL